MPLSPSTPATDVATLGGGCFWCVEAAFLELAGVTKVVSGYAGGTTPHPTYEQVCTGQTGHAEVVQVTFDPAVITYEDLLRVFFTIHDPTTPNRQGADVGTQYRSIILTASDAQAIAARAIIDEFTAQKIFPAPIVTEIVALGAFYAAEPEHQSFFLRNPTNAYCQITAVPKLLKLRKAFRDRLRTPPQQDHARA